MTVVALFIDSLDSGGAETLVVEICRRLDRYGFKPRLLHFGNEWIAGQCDAAGIDHEVVPWHALFKSNKTLPLFCFRFARYLRERRIDLLHSHLFGAITAAAPAAFLAGMPHVGTSHDVYVIQERPLRIRLFQLAALLGTRLVAVSAQMQRYFLSVGRFPRHAWSVTINGTDIVRYHPREKLAVRAQLELPEGDFLFVCVARLTPIKRIDVLLEAFSRLLPSPSVKLILVGDGPSEAELREVVHAKGLADRVLFTGLRNDVEMLLAASDCFVLSSDSEGLPCSILEAMASGLPIIATDVGGIGEIVVPGRNGYLVPKGGVGALSSRMREMVENAEFRSLCGKNSRTAVEGSYSVDSMVSAYVSRYRELLQIASGSPAARFRHWLWSLGITR